MKKSALLAVAAAVLGAALALFAILRLSPWPELDAYLSRPSGLVVEDRNGVVLRVIPAGDGVKREWAGLGTIPPGAVRIFLRAEDRRFYFHPGVDPLAVLAGAARNLLAGKVVSGASTITMQLARLVSPHGPGLGGKTKEAWNALRLSARLPRKAILELWLNGIPFGSNAEGLPAMTRLRFGHSVTMLDDAEALLLAVTPRNPSRYDPALNPAASAAAAHGLSRRLRLSLDGETLLARALAAAETEDADARTPFRAPHFTERLGREIGGRGLLRARSSLDIGLQTMAEELLAAELAGLSGNRVSNGAVLVIENATGAARAYIGSRSWFDDENSGKIDGVRTPNQPGSCLKPFLYAMALDAGFGPEDILPDIPSVFGTGEAYIPSNFNNRFNGPVRLRVCLASSLNVPAVYLLERLGVEAFERYLSDLGFASVAARRGGHGTGLALGNAEVSLEELVTAFAAFPRGGIPVRLVLVEDAPPAAGPRIMSPGAAWMIADILSDRQSRFTGFGQASALDTEFPAMFKTGTANQYQHIWALGATGRYTAGVWMGNFSGETVVGRTGSSIPARIVSQLLSWLEPGEAPPPGGPPPPGIEAVEICALSGMSPGPFCPGTLTEWTRPQEGSPPAAEKACGWHRGAEPVYPPEYQSWLVERFRAGGADRDGGGWIRLPAPGSVFYLDLSQPSASQALRVETAGFGEEALVYADGVLAGRLNRAGVFVLPLARGRHEILVEDGRGGDRVSIEIR